MPLTLVALILLVAPYVGELDFGIFKIPDLGDQADTVLRWFGPILTLLAIAFFLPLIPKLGEQERACLEDAVHHAEDVLRLIDSTRNEAITHGGQLLHPDEQLHRTIALAVSDSFDRDRILVVNDLRFDDLKKLAKTVSNDFMSIRLIAMDTAYGVTTPQTEMGDPITDDPIVAVERFSAALNVFVSEARRRLLRQ